MLGYRFLFVGALQKVRSLVATGRRSRSDTSKAPGAARNANGCIGRSESGRRLPFAQPSFRFHWLKDCLGPEFRPQDFDSRKLRVSPLPRAFVARDHGPELRTRDQWKHSLAVRARSVVRVPVFPDEFNLPAWNAVRTVRSSKMSREFRIAITEGLPPPASSGMEHATAGDFPELPEALNEGSSRPRAGRQIVARQLNDVANVPRGTLIQYHRRVVADVRLRVLRSEALIVGDDLVGV